MRNNHNIINELFSGEFTPEGLNRSFPIMEFEKRINKSFISIPSNVKMDNLTYNLNTIFQSSLELGMVIPNPNPIFQSSLELEMGNPNPNLIFQSSLELEKDYLIPNQNFQSSLELEKDYLIPNQNFQSSLELDSPNPNPNFQSSLELEMDSLIPNQNFQSSLELEMDRSNANPIFQNSLEKVGMNKNIIDNSSTIIQNPLEKGMNCLTDNLDKIIQNNPIEGGMNNYIDNSTPFPQNSLEERINNFIDNPNDDQNSLPTGSNIAGNMPNPHQISLSNIETISSKSIKNAVLIDKNNNTNIGLLHQNLNNSEKEITIEKTKKNQKKKQGRRKKGSNLKGGHTGNYPGNILRKCGTAFMDSLYTALNYRCKIHNIRRLKKINFNNQFGYNKDNKKFINQKIYKILRNENKNNQEVLKKMAKKKDIVFMYMINCTFEHLYRKYIRGKNKLCISYSGIDKKIKCFETLTEIANKKELSKQFNEEWTKEQFIKTSKQFLNEVNGKGNLKFRERRNKNKVPYQYEKVEEIEYFFKNNKVIFLNNYIKLFVEENF